VQADVVVLRLANVESTEKVVVGGGHYGWKTGGLGAQPPKEVGEYWHVRRVIYETGEICAAEKAFERE
jgi:hypothetical protein